MENQKDLEILSCELYDYLSNFVVGSEKAVKYRRCFYRCFDDCLNFKKGKLISSGSKAEGLDLPGSDLDLMFLLEEVVVDKTHSGEKEELFVLDTDNASPGFALIKVPENKSEFRDVRKSITGCFLSNDYIKERAFSKASMPAQVMQKSFKIQGPSVDIALKGVFDVDFVISLSCREWPNVARMWI